MFNVENFQTLIRANEGARDFGHTNGIAHGFHMSAVWHNDGSPACALGHYLHYLHARGKTCKDRSTHLNFLEFAAHEFGITLSEASDLFNPCGCGCAHTDHKKAVAYLRDFFERKMLEAQGVDESRLPVRVNDPLCPIATALHGFIIIERTPAVYGTFRTPEPVDS